MKRRVISRMLQSLIIVSFLFLLPTIVASQQTIDSGSEYKLEKEQSYRNYTVRIFNNPGRICEETLEILKDGKVIHKETGGCSFKVGNFYKEEEPKKWLLMKTRLAIIWFQWGTT